MKYISETIETFISEYIISGILKLADGIMEKFGVGGESPD